MSKILNTLQNTSTINQTLGYIAITGIVLFVIFIIILAIIEGIKELKKKYNKKAQYYPQPSYATVHPVLIIGVALFILPFMLPVFGITPTALTKNILMTTSIIIILIGGAMSIFKASN